MLATQTLQLKQSKSMEVRVEGEVGPGVTAKDIVLHITGCAGRGRRHRICDRIYRQRDPRAQHRGPPDRQQHGDRARRTRRPLRPRREDHCLSERPPDGAKGADWDAGGCLLANFETDPGATYDKVVVIDAADIAPSVTWGTSPEDVVPITGTVPDPASFADPSKQEAAAKSLVYMGLEPGTPLREVEVQNIFIGSCTNSRIEDLRAAAAVLKGRKKAANIRWGIVVPGSGLVKAQAEAEGLDRIFIDAGLEWREPGCSACLGMNPDKVPAGERCASTSNRNFVGRQGPGARTHLVSPAMAAAAAVTGKLTDVRELIA